MSEQELLKLRIELEELRAFKRTYEASSMNRAFIRLEQVLDAPYKLKADTVMSITAFRILAECVLELKRAVIDGQEIEERN